MPDDNEELRSVSDILRMSDSGRYPLRRGRRRNLYHGQCPERPASPLPPPPPRRPKVRTGHFTGFTLKPDAVKEFLEELAREHPSRAAKKSAVVAALLRKHPDASHPTLRRNAVQSTTKVVAALIGKNVFVRDLALGNGAPEDDPVLRF